MSPAEARISAASAGTVESCGIMSVLRPASEAASAGQDSVVRQRRELYRARATRVLPVLESGATAEICTSVLFDARRYMEVYGAEGFAICEDTLGADGGGRIETREGRLDFEVVNPYVGEIDDFVDAVSRGRSPEVDGEGGLDNVEILLRAIEA